LDRQGILVYFNSSQPVEPFHRTRGSSGAALSQEAGAGAQGACDSLEAASEPGGGSWSHEVCGGSGAVLSQETGAEATRHVAASELP
jgi:hypothetical protein